MTTGINAQVAEAWENSSAMVTRGVTLDVLMERLAQVEQGLVRMEAARNEAGEDVDPIVLEQLDALGRRDTSDDVIAGKDMRIIVFGFRPKTKQRRAVIDALWRCTRPLRLWDMYTFTCGPSKYKNTSPNVRLLNEYIRLLGKGSDHVSRSSFEDRSRLVSNEWWRISEINSNYTMCSTYPSLLIVPKNISDEEVLQASSFRARGRLPAVSWCHPGRYVRDFLFHSDADEKLVAALCTQITGSKGVVFLGIDNIHAMRESLVRLRDYLDTHGAASSDGMSSFMFDKNSPRNGGWTWGGGNLSSMSASVSTLGDSGWLIHIQNVLAGSAWIAARVGLESSSVLVHCSDGWDRTAQLVSLASLLLDPYYRTFSGFQALVEKDWLAFGHPFSDRAGMPTISGNDIASSESLRQSSSGNLPSTPARQPPGSSNAQSNSLSHPQMSSNYSPIFLQVFLVDFLDCVLSCRFGNFLGNSFMWMFYFPLLLCTGHAVLILIAQHLASLKRASVTCNDLVNESYFGDLIERQQSGIADSCGCLWVYLAELRSSEGNTHPHYNFFYDSLKHVGPLLPPAAALAPTLWPQFHLRWACPTEAQAGEVEAQCRAMAKKFSDLQMAKEVAEKKAKDIAASVESLTAELQKEKQISYSATDKAKRSFKESVALKRAIESLGCGVSFSSSGECAVDIEDRAVGSQTRLACSSRNVDGIQQSEDQSDVSVSISVQTDKDAPCNRIARACESLCPFSSREDVCKWPHAGCVQFDSQLVGVKANFDAFDKLSIYDCYFGL
ncbi:hypothetical protein Syun_000591 [Stephania yunnanensis]|uniref:Myotubularin phosphatase domain-containing protein n=1 Tax=Stephania yunnanensis TaxID=152371 RepID=A0AAP0LCI0_9MAGN